MDNPLQAHLDIANDWAERTELVLKESIKKLGIGVTDELYSSLSTQVIQKGGELIDINLTFLARGRFVDMGAGQGYKKGVFESMASNKEKLIGRKPKKWYSKPFYGRINALMGITGATISEQAVRAIIEPLQQISD